MTEIRQNLFWTGARKLYRSRLAAAGLDLHWGLLVLPLLFDTKTQHLISNDLVFWRLVSCHNITIPWAMEVKLIGHGSAASIFWATPPQVQRSLGSQWTTVKHHLQIVRFLGRWPIPQLKVMDTWPIIGHIAQERQIGESFMGSITSFQQRLIPADCPLHVGKVPLHSPHESLNFMSSFILKMWNFKMGCSVCQTNEPFGLAQQCPRPHQQRVLAHHGVRHFRFDQAEDIVTTCIRMPPPFSRCSFRKRDVAGKT